MRAELDIHAHSGVHRTNGQTAGSDFDIRDFDMRKDLGNRAQHALRQPGFNLDSVLLQQESYYIEAALMLTGGNISEAAKLLGINRTTLYSRLEVLHKHKIKLANSSVHDN